MVEFSLVKLLLLLLLLLLLSLLINNNDNNNNNNNNNNKLALVKSQQQLGISASEILFPETYSDLNFQLTEKPTDHPD